MPRALAPRIFTGAKYEKLPSKSFYKSLDYVNHSRENRQVHARMLLEKPKQVKETIAMFLMVDDALSTRAGWLLEYALRKDINILNPYLNPLIKNMHKIHLDGALRPAAKMCELLVTQHYEGKYSSGDFLSRKQRETITEIACDWLTTNQKVAPKAYSMTTLYLLGTKYAWIHPELTRVLELGYSEHSAAYKARTRMTLAKIKKTQR